MTINNKLLKIDTLVKLLTEDPQENIINILTSNILLNQSEYSSGVLSLSSIPSGSSISSTIEELFLENSEILTESCNTIILFSEYPFDLLVGDSLDNIQTNLYHFSFSSEDSFEISVANRSEENDIQIRYLIAIAESLGSSYVYT